MRITETTKDGKKIYKEMGKDEKIICKAEAPKSSFAEIEATCKASVSTSDLVAIRREFAGKIMKFEGGMFIGAGMLLDLAAAFVAYQDSKAYAAESTESVTFASFLALVDPDNNVSDAMKSNTIDSDPDLSGFIDYFYDVLVATGDIQ